MSIPEIVRSMAANNRDIARRIIHYIIKDISALYEAKTPIHEMTTAEKRKVLINWVDHTEYVINQNYGTPGNDKYLEGYFDGSASPNPGLMSVGFCIMNKLGHIIVEDRANLQEGTNNQAEYLGFIMLVKRLLTFKPEHVKIIGDSQLVIKQLKGDWKVKKPELKELYKQANNLLGQLKRYELCWVKRTENSIADKLSKRV